MNLVFTLTFLLSISASVFADFEGVYQALDEQRKKDTLILFNDGTFKIKSDVYKVPDSKGWEERKWKVENKKIVLSSGSSEETIHEYIFDIIQDDDSIILKYFVTITKESGKRGVYSVSILAILCKMEESG